MSTTTSHGSANANAVVRVASRVHVTVPASKAVRAAVLADFRAKHGLDLSDDDRAAKVRSKRR